VDANMPARSGPRRNAPSYESTLCRCQARQRTATGFEFHPPDGYYKPDVYLYYVSTFVLPLIVGWRKTPA
jgi:hypothetical protein